MEPPVEPGGWASVLPRKVGSSRSAPLFRTMSLTIVRTPLGTPRPVVGAKSSSVLLRGRAGCRVYQHAVRLAQPPGKLDGNSNTPRYDGQVDSLPDSSGVMRRQLLAQPLADPAWPLNASPARARFPLTHSSSDRGPEGPGALGHSGVEPGKHFHLSCELAIRRPGELAPGQVLLQGRKCTAAESAVGAHSTWLNRPGPGRPDPTVAGGFAGAAGQRDRPLTQGTLHPVTPTSSSSCAPRPART